LEDESNLLWVFTALNEKIEMPESQKKARDKIPFCHLGSSQGV